MQFIKKNWLYVSYILLAAIISSYVTVKLNQAQIKFYGPNGTIYEASIPNQQSASLSVTATYSDFLAITLTAMTVVIGVGAIVIALIAFLTIADIKKNAEKAAQEHVSAAVNTQIEGLSEKIRNTIESNVNTSLPSHINNQLVEMQMNGQMSALMDSAVLRMSQMDADTADELSQENR